MTYLGGCGWDLPATAITIEAGRQTTKTRRLGNVRSTAKVTDRSLVRLGGETYGLVELTCEVGRDTLHGYHLVAWRSSGPVDLGIIAANLGAISIKPKKDKIAVSYRYQTSYDSNAQRSGRTEYRVAVVGSTPIRLYGRDKRSAVDSAVTALEPQAWAAGIVGVSGYVYEKSQTTWTIGVLTKARQVQLPWALGAPQSECWIPTVHTQANERIAYRKMVFTDGPRNLSGTIMTLAKSSIAPPGATTSTATPLKHRRKGLLIEAQGRVPALATAEPERTEFSKDETVVFSGVPTDELLFSHWFEIGQDPENNSGPPAAFMSGDGQVLMLGSWSHIPFSEGQIAGYGMVGMPDPADRRVLGC